MSRKPVMTLFDCSRPKVSDGRILCASGHRFTSLTADGGIAAARLARGKSLEIKACQGCADFSPMDGGEVKSWNKGWPN